MERLVLLQDRDRALRVVAAPGEGGMFQFLEFDGPSAVGEFLRPHQANEETMQRLREVLGYDGSLRDTFRLDNAQVIDQVAWRVHAGRLAIARELPQVLHPITTLDEAPAPGPVDPDNPPPKPKKLVWIEIQVMDDATAKPVPWCRMAVRTPDGNAKYYTTDASGLIRIEDIEPGTCDAYCDTKEARLATTRGFVAMGQAAASDPKQPKPADVGAIRILQVEEHEVKDGETLDGLASKAGMTPDELSTFNYGDDPAPELAPKDKVFIPRKWEQNGLATEQRHIVRVKVLVGVKRVWLIELEHLHFHFDSAVLLPDYEVGDPDPSKPAKDRVTALSVLGEALRQARDHSDRRMLITGHTDTTGSAQYNLPLSQQRADSALAALMGDREKWVATSNAKHKVEDYQIILKWARRDLGWDCDPGTVDNADGPKTRTALKKFQQRYNSDFSASIAEDGLIGPETWGAFFDLYMRELANVMEVDEPTLASMRSSVKFVDDGKKAVGCGENFPKDHRGVDGWRSTENRRIEILFFQQDQLPTTECHAGGQCKAALCVINDPKKYIPVVIPVPAHPPKVGPIIQVDDAPNPPPAAAGGGEGQPAQAAPAAGGDAGAAPAPGAPAAGAAPEPAPEISDAPNVVVMSKPWAPQPRRPITLRTDVEFDGTGTLTITGTAIKFFDAEKDGNEITSSANNTFAGDKLKPPTGTKIYAQAVAASAAMKDVKLTLTLTGGTKKAKPPAQQALTAIEVVLDICGERTAAGTDPAPLAQPPDAAPAAGTVAADKFYGGRFIQKQDAGNNCGRAMLIVRKVSPAAYTGDIILALKDAADTKLKLFDAEGPGAGSAVALPRTIANKDIPAKGLKLWVEGAGTSAALRDSTLKLDVKDVATNVDAVTLTVVEFTKIKATIKSTPPNKARPGIPLPADHTFESTKLEEDFDDAKNQPLVLMRNAQPDIALEVTVKPDAPVDLPIVWRAIRNTADHATLGGKADVPTVTAVAGNRRKATLSADNKGSFRIRPFIDTNGSNDYNAKEPSMPLNLVLADATLVADNSAGLTANVKSSLNATDFNVRNGAWPGTWAACIATPNGAGMTMEIVADVTGGGADGRLGLNKVFGGLVNMLRGNDITLTYQQMPAPAAPAVAATYTVNNRYVLNPAAATGVYNGSPLFQPGAAAPNVLDFPMLDTGRSPGGVGADTALMSRSGTFDPAPPNRPVGQRYTLRCIDSPGRSFLLVHPDHADARLVRVHYVQQFRANFCFWTNITKVRTQSGDAADRVYGALRTMDWDATGDWNITWAAPAAGGALAPTATNTNAHTISVTNPNTVSPIGRAQDNAVEVRPPSGITTAIAWVTT